MLGSAQRAPSIADVMSSFRGRDISDDNVLLYRFLSSKVLVKMPTAKPELLAG